MRLASCLRDVIAEGRWRARGGALLIVAMFFLLGSCGTRATDPVWQSVLNGLGNLPGDTLPPVSLSEHQDRIRRLVAEDGGDAPVLMVTLPTRQVVATMMRRASRGGFETWVDGSGISMTMRGGIVVSTRGLGQDVMASDVSGTLAAQTGTGPERYPLTRRRLTPDGALQAHVTQCTFTIRPDAFIETCRGAERFENVFARTELDRSRQWLGPALGYAVIERLR